MTPSSPAADRDFMRQALALAAKGKASTHPNPRVGCVIVRDGAVVGSGWHRRAGEAHAEIEALQAAGTAARGATVYVTLEPCSHFGRTPPCVDALISAAVARVVAAMPDPNPRIAGRGLDHLREAGIAVEVGLCGEEAAELNRPFVSRHLRGRPWLVLKLAASLDGRTAMASGESRWITGEAARSDVHHWRAEMGAVLSTAATVMADDARLDVRLPGQWRQPDRIVLDRLGRVPPTAVVWAAGARRIAVMGEAASPALCRQLRARDVEVLRIAEQDNGHLPLATILQALAETDINGVLVECGARLAGSLVSAGLADELLIYVAPRLLGADARPLACLPGLEKLADAPRWRFVSTVAMGEDVRLHLRTMVQNRTSA